MRGKLFCEAHLARYEELCERDHRAALTYSNRRTYWPTVRS